MKKIILMVLSLLLTFALILWVKGNTVREIRTEIEINAPTEKVWRTLTDIDQWAQWSPIINEANGVAALGSELSITMRGDDGEDGPQYLPIITSFEAPKTFRWRAKMMSEFLFTNDKVFELEETGTGTRLIHKELFSGMFVPLFWSKFNDNVPSMLKSMNEALKKEVEKDAGSKPKGQTP